LDLSSQEETGIKKGKEIVKSKMGLELKVPKCPQAGINGLDNDDPFFLVKRLVVLFHMVATLSHTNIYLGFSTGNKVHKNYLEYGL
jgi:hypothetical protein